VRKVLEKTENNILGYITHVPVLTEFKCVQLCCKNEI